MSRFILNREHHHDFIDLNLLSPSFIKATTDSKYGSRAIILHILWLTNQIRLGDHWSTRKDGQNSRNGYGRSAKGPASTG
jgi:hypothetical protein